VRDNKAGLRLASNDHIAQVSVICLNIALAGAKRQALLLVMMQFTKNVSETDLLKKLSEAQTNHPIGSGSVRGTRVTTKINVSPKPGSRNTSISGVTWGHRDPESPSHHKHA
jgi:hypothetical protein